MTFSLLSEKPSEAQKRRPCFLIYLLSLIQYWSWPGDVDIAEVRQAIRNISLISLENERNLTSPLTRRGVMNEV